MKLTARETQVLHKLCDGLPDKRIALDLNISIYTVQAHIAHIYAKLELKDRAINRRCAAVVSAFRRGLCA